MNLPNKLTLFRVFLVPVFVFLLLTGYQWAALGVFFLACFTDFADGRIARKYNLVTNFGKFMDPLADKLLICSALVCLVELGTIPAWITIIIIAREFVVSGLRLIAADAGIVIAASWWGKFKTASQMIMITLLVANIEKFKYLTEMMIWLTLALTLISMIDYIWQNRAVFSKKT